MVWDFILPRAAPVRMPPQAFYPVTNTAKHRLAHPGSLRRGFPLSSAKPSPGSGAAYGTGQYFRWVDKRVTVPKAERCRDARCRRAAVAESAQEPVPNTQGHGVRKSALSVFLASLMGRRCKVKKLLLCTAFLLWCVAYFSGIAATMIPATAVPLKWARAIGDFVTPELGEFGEVLCLLLATTAIVPMVMRFKTSPIIGFLCIGVLLGPSGLGIMRNLAVAHKMAELGIVFFLFENGLELSIKKVWSMRSDVFGLGGLQFFTSAICFGGLAHMLNPSLSLGALVVLGGALALSSSAFALQLLRDQGKMGTRYGRASFGALLLQDLAVVPLLVLLPLLGASSGNFAQAALTAIGKAAVALGLIVFSGEVLLQRVFHWVKRSGSNEAFLAATLGVVLLCSQITEGLGLSNTLGAFVGGVMVAETNFRHQVEADIAPFRGLLLGLFFVTVGFALDLKLLMASWTTVIPLLLGIVTLKACVITCVCLLFRLSFASALQSAALLAPGGEFAFVLFRLAEQLQLVPPELAGLLVNTTILSMGLTPVLVAVFGKFASRLRAHRGNNNLVGTDQRAVEDIGQIERSPEGFVVMCGWNNVTRAVCELLDEEARSRYIVLESDPVVATRAHDEGLPVYLVDCTRREVLDKFRVGDARLVILASNRELADRHAMAIRNLYPDLKILARAEDEHHKEYLERKFDVKAVIPQLISMRFGGLALRCLGYPPEEVDGLVDQHRRRIFEENLD